MNEIRRDLEALHIRKSHILLLLASNSFVKYSEQDSVIYLALGHKERAVRSCKDHLNDVGDLVNPGNPGQVATNHRITELNVASGFMHPFLFLLVLD